jgi:pyridoxal phosphate enzyme (YggS family)
MNEELVNSIRDRHLDVLRRVNEARARSGNQTVRLLVVSKSQSVEVVQAAVAAGITAFGENYAEEAVKKIIALRQTEVEWHMIGHVQSRKADLVVQNFTMLHSLDSLKLAARINQCCLEAGCNLSVLVEVNISGEDSKYGFPAWDETGWPNLLQVFESIAQSSHLNIHGLMAMPPYFEDPEFSRPYFRRLRLLQEFLIQNLPRVDWSELSMGTSIDFQEAIEEGATYVRIGQAILGARSSPRI